MEHGPIIGERRQTTWLLEGGIRFFLAAALTASQTTGGYAPFALGLVAAAGPGIPGAAALAGTAAGSLLFLDFAEALPHLAIAILILTAATSFRGSSFLGSPKAQVLTAAGLTLAVQGIYVAQSLSPLEHLTPCLAAVGLTGASAWFFRPLLQPDGERPLRDGVLFLTAALLLAFMDLTLLGISLGRAALCTLLAYAAYDQGLAAGAAIGLGLGLTVDLCTGSGNGLFTAGFGFAGLLAGSRQGHRRSTAAVAFLLAVLAALLPAEEPFSQPLLVEALLGMAVFLLLPGRLFGGKRVAYHAHGVMLIIVIYKRAVFAYNGLHGPLAQHHIAPACGPARYGDKLKPAFLQLPHGGIRFACQLAAVCYGIVHVEQYIFQLIQLTRLFFAKSLHVCPSFAQQKRP